MSRNKPQSILSGVVYALIAVPVFIAVVGLCIMNAHTTEFMWWPFAPTLAIPVFAIMLGLFATGFLAGCLLTGLERK